MKNRRNRKLYVVGYVGEFQCVYGPDAKGGASMYCDRMTLPQATRKLKSLNTPDSSRAIFKLVPVLTVKAPRSRP